MAWELDWDDWTVEFTVGLSQAPRQVPVRARDLHGLLAQIAQIDSVLDMDVGIYKAL
jgi:hypothetical protein